MQQSNGNRPDSGEARRRSRCLIARRWLCLAGGTIGLIGLLGWATNNALLYTGLPGAAPIMPNTALAIALAGVAGALRCGERPRLGAVILSSIAALVVLGIGLGTLAEYAFGIDLRIDELLFASRVGSYPGRPSAPGAVAFMFLAGAILLLDFRPGAATRPSEWLLLLATLVGVVGLTGQILGPGSAHHLTPSPIVGISLAATVGILLLAVGMLLARPSAGIMAVATSDGPGGILLRRFAVPSIVMPILLGFIIARLFQVSNIEDYPIIVASVAVAITMSGFVVLLITARLLNRSHDDLQSSRARTRALIALAADGVFVADTNGRYLEVNEAGSRMLGLPESQIVGRKITEFIPPDEHERLRATREELLGGGVQIAEWHMRHKSGEWIPVEVSTGILPDGRWQAIIRDIRERKAAEEEARRSRARIEGLVSIAADAIISIDESQRITLFNHSAEEMFGWAAREAIGQPLDILIPERFRVVHRAHVRAFGAEATTVRRAADRGPTIYGLRKGGTEFVAEATISKLRIGDEQTFTVVMRDVTDQRRREAQEKGLAAIGLLLTSTLDRAQIVRGAANLLVDGFADACAVDALDPDDPTHRMTHSAVVHRDPAMAATAHRLEQFRMTSAPSRFSLDMFASTRPALIKHVTRQHLDAIARSEEHRRLIDEIAPTSGIWVPLRARGTLIGLLTMVSTNPARPYDEVDSAFAAEVGQRLALAIDNARLFESAKNAITGRDEVLRIVAHDLRNPLGTILMRAALLRQNGHEVEGDGRQTAEGIITAANRMNRLIQDLLDVMRSEDGKLTVERFPMAAGAVMRSAVAAQSALADKASIDLRAEVPDDLPKVLADPDRIRQIFENLIGNALKFTPKGGHITVGVRRRDGDAMFWVKDTGEGMSADDLGHVFDRFWQGRNKKSYGAGLGSSIVKALVEAHGGRVWAESAPGRGSTFYFTIPIAAEAASAPPAVSRAG